MVVLVVEPDHFDAIKDFTPIAWVLTTPYVVVAHPNVPVSTMTELVAYAKAETREALLLRRHGRRTATPERRAPEAQ